MPDPLQQHYETLTYPAMSHPPSDPALTAASAWLRGHRAPDPAHATILEIGCGSGLNLIPLALRWPKSRLVGIDLSRTAVAEAQALAVEAGVSNVRFIAADLREFRTAPGAVDFIIAHGFLSWVPDDVKAALFTCCEHSLSPQGIATISFNVRSGWEARFPVIKKTRAILAAGAGDIPTALGILRSVTEPDSPEIPIIDDMLAKGPSILAFDDFGPVNDPLSLEEVVRTAENSRLKWIGESEYAENFRTSPSGELPDQIAADAENPRTFRSTVFSKKYPESVDFESVIESIPISVHPSSSVANEELKQLIESDAFAESRCVPLDSLPFPPAVLKQLLESGELIPRTEPLRFDPRPPERPCLNSFRLACARRHLPLVDVWHRACAFPEAQYPILSAMDGTRDIDGLARFSESHCPNFDFRAWLGHLASRGMFA
ncbi:MAG: class I SAM-dependent methyltransferase [Akkermansiaceae bacterium]|jgi:SAM-dependent methyltransferase|nr:class I SAM-dependent methyltransferase [Akkermansiaceae bacterium]